jgi:choline dehydrogenase-like flavoprotein
VPQGYYARDPDIENIIFETATVGAGELFMLFGKVAQEKIIDRFRYWSMSGVMLRDDGHGRVSEGILGRKDIEYALTQNDLISIKKGLLRLIDVYEAAGAKSLCPLIRPLTFYDRAEDARQAIRAVTSSKDFAHLHASHPHGTARMGADVHSGVVDAHGKVFGTEGLWVVDGSLMPSTLGVNPQVTIVAMAAMIGQHIAAS